MLPTTYAAITRDLLPAIEESGPDAILMIGVAGRSRAIRVEAFGRNRASTLLPDAARFTPTSLRLADGPALRRTGMRPAGQAATLRRQGLKACVSPDAGRYLCNAAYFAALGTPLPVLFVHFPKAGRALVRQPGAKRRVSWQERLAKGLVEVATDLVRRGRASAVMPGLGPGIHAFLADGR